MKSRFLLRSGCILIPVVGAGFLWIYAHRSRPVGSEVTWLDQLYERVTGTSVETRTRRASRRCAQNLSSTYTRAESVANDEVPPGMSGPEIKHNLDNGILTQALAGTGSGSSLNHHRPESAVRAAGPDAETVVYFIDVFASAVALEPLRKGVGSFPPGSVILKRKSLGKDGESTQYYTGMRKRHAGYWPEVSDWEFFVLAADGAELETGRLRNCADCHLMWSDQNFLSRSYLKPEVKGQVNPVINASDEPD